MPQGKGTYGSKVGRPPKKGKKYQAGGEIPGETEAVMDAAMTGQELKSISLENIPTENAPDRNEASPIGNEVGTGMYKEGGAVKDVKSPNGLERNPMKLKDRRLAKTPPQKGGGMAQSAKQKEEHRIAAEKARKRHLKEQSEYGKPKKKKKWSGQA